MILQQLDINMQKNQVGLLYVQTNSKWIIDLNVRAKTIKILEENICLNLSDLGLGNGFLHMTPKAQAIN